MSSKSAKSNLAANKLLNKLFGINNKGSSVNSKPELPRDENGVPNPATLAEAVAAIKDYIHSSSKVYHLISRLEKLLPPDEAADFSGDELKGLFLTGSTDDMIFTSALSMNPSSIATVTISEILNDANRFTRIDPNTLPEAAMIKNGYPITRLTHTTVELGSESITVPVADEVWVTDKITGTNLVVTYEPANGGGLAVSVESSYAKSDANVEFSQELKFAVLKSPHIKGRIIEITGGNGFRIVEIGEQILPIMSKELKSELEKNVINLFDKQESFKKYGLPLKRSIILEGPPGNGKCLAKGTPVMMWDGTIKKVEDIRVGEQLMGDDSAPRSVLSLARGIEKMFRVDGVDGSSYTVNESHILSLMCSGSGKVTDISVKDFNALPSSRRALLKGYKAKVEKFGNQKSDLKLDPYFLGLWLGNGNSREPQVTTADQEIIEYLEGYASSNGLQTTRVQNLTDNKASTIGLTEERTCVKINPIMSELRSLGLIYNKHIPRSYKTASVPERLRLLAGLVDSDGSNNNDCIDYTSKDEVLADDVVFIARSLGMKATKSVSVKAAKFADGTYSENGTYYGINISGELSLIPTLLKRKQFYRRKQIKNPRLTGISLTELPADRYYGFEIDGNRRFLLGDFTVTHNTMLCRWLASSVKGKVTTIWVTAKSIQDQSDVASVFDIARKLAPSLVIMEDLDLISGTRDILGRGAGALGEMLNQLDGLEANDSLVLVGSTNRVSSLDEALRDRPGRFDRIYEVGKPSPELAEQIAKNYLRSRGVSENALSFLDLSQVMNGEFTGAQVVEIVKGGIFEAIHENKEITELHVKKSRDGLIKQRKLTQKP